MARADAEKIVLQWMDDIDPSGDNTKRWKAKFKSMDDEVFKYFVDTLRQGLDYISVVSPNFTNTQVGIENNFRVARKYGVKMFQRIWTTDPVTGRQYLSNDEYPVFHLPVRRQIQMAKEKFSYAHNNDKTDSLTGQPTGESEGGSISYPEVLVLYSRGLSKSVEELIWARGGNKGAFRMMNKKIQESGSCTLKELEPHSTGIKSTKILSTYMKAIHIANNV